MSGCGGHARHHVALGALFDFGGRRYDHFLHRTWFAMAVERRKMTQQTIRVSEDAEEFASMHFGF